MRATLRGPSEDRKVLTGHRYAGGSRGRLGNIWILFLEMKEGDKNIFLNNNDKQLILCFKRELTPGRRVHSRGKMKIL